MNQHQRAHKRMKTLRVQFLNQKSRDDDFMLVETKKGKKSREKARSRSNKFHSTLKKNKSEPADVEKFPIVSYDYLKPLMVSHTQGDWRTDAALKDQYRILKIVKRPRDKKKAPVPGRLGTTIKILKSPESNMKAVHKKKPTTARENEFANLNIEDTGRRSHRKQDRRRTKHKSRDSIEESKLETWGEAEDKRKKVTFADTCSYRTIDSSPDKSQSTLRNTEMRELSPVTDQSTFRTKRVSSGQEAAPWNNRQPVLQETEQGYTRRPYMNMLSGLRSVPYTTFRRPISAPKDREGYGNMTSAGTFRIESFPELSRRKFNFIENGRLTAPRTKYQNNDYDFLASPYQSTLNSFSMYTTPKLYTSGYSRGYQRFSTSASPAVDKYRRYLDARIH